VGCMMHHDQCVSNFQVAHAMCTISFYEEDCHTNHRIVGVQSQLGVILLRPLWTRYKDVLPYMRVGINYSKSWGGLRVDVRQRLISPLGQQ
jgi:hypothetical protein